MGETGHTRLVTLFERALALPPGERAAFVEEACGTDQVLRNELTSLLHASDSASGYFDALSAEMIAPAYESITGGAQSAANLLPQLQAALEGAYRIDRELGGGAMSRVFLAEDVKLGRKVVIKVLPPEMAASVSADRFRREIQVAAQLQHPHIVPLLTSDSVGSILYYTMPFVAGESLHARLAREGTLPMTDAIGISRHVFDALAHAHANGVVHRDIKPANIMLGGRNALVTDFGIARAIEAAAGDALLTGTGLAIGTPTYMAPEQITGTPDADHRVDIYAAGLVMYEMIEGRAPFSADSVRELVLARLASGPPPLIRADCPAALSELVLRCLATDPADRPVSSEAVLAELDAKEFAPRGPAVGTAPRRKQRRLAYAVAALALAATMFGAWRFSRAVGDDAPAATGAGPSVAVLPLTSLTADVDAATLTHAMTEELIATLSKVGNLRVVARTSVVALKDRGLDVRQIAESLRVSHVLEGGLQKVGSRLRMQVRLVDARAGTMAWSASYDRDMKDVFAVQDEIARAIASELDVRLVGTAHRLSRRRRTPPNIAAYELYLRGMDLTLLGGRPQYQEARSYFDQAIALDTSFAPAYAALSEVYTQMAGDAQDYKSWFARAEEVALKAVALDDSLAEAHTALGWSRITLRAWAGAEAAFRKAISLDPRLPRAHEGLARVYLFTGNNAEQLAAARKAIALDPFSNNAGREMALALNINGRCAESLPLLRPFKTLNTPFAPAGIIGGLCYAQMQQWAQAIAEFRWTLEHTDARTALAFLGYALARGAQEDEARAILSDLLAGRKSSHGAFGVAVVYAGLRQYDQAFAWLEKAVAENSVRVYLFDPAFEDLHRDPRFDQVRTWLQLPLDGRPARRR